MFNQVTIPKPPPIEDVHARVAWDATDKYWREVIGPSISGGLADFKAEVKALINSFDVALRSAETRMQSSYDKFSETAEKLNEYMVRTESTIGSLRASDNKQDQGITDLWSKINALNDRVQRLENSLTVVEHVQAGLRADIYGDVSTNTPGINGTLREMRLEIVGKLTAIEKQQTDAAAAIQRHEKDIEKLKENKSWTRRLRLWLAGE